MKVGHRNAAGMPLTYRGRLWTKIIDAMVGSNAAADGDILYRTGGFWSRLPIEISQKLLVVASGVPAWGARQVGGGVGYSGTIYQTTDLVITNATTGSTFVDTELVLRLLPGTYYFEIHNFCTVNATPDWKGRLHFTGTASELRYMHASIIESNTSYFNSFRTAFDEQLNFTSTATCTITYRGTLTVTVAGDLSHQVGQGTPSATAITAAKRGSYMTGYQIG